jgi:AraC-like DNA-binding protein
MLDELLRSSADIPKGMLNLKPHIMTLIADFFSRIYNKPVADVLESKIMHYQKMLQVEGILRSCMEKNLPDIETIARMVMLSVSTLKRHFKLAYGKGVYDHYLEMKMEYAKRLLMEKDLSVNEVATMMNYEKVSSFIDMFKKHQGCSPGILRKKAS